MSELDRRHFLVGAAAAGAAAVVLDPVGFARADPGTDQTRTLTGTIASFGPDTAPFVPRHAPLRAAGRGRGWYRGDTHLHTVPRRDLDRLAVPAADGGLARSPPSG